MPFSDHQIDDLRERADIAAIIGRRVQLKKRGKDYLGLCPFHGERTPSFNVIPGKHFWHCFGCQESGDVFRFFMKLDGLPFVEAVKHVATEAGVILAEERFDPEEARRRAHLDDLASLLDRAVRFYEQKLAHATGAPARDHLVKRGISEEYLHKFHLGFGGAGRSELARALSKAGAPLDLAVEAGLCVKSQRGGDPFDRFQGRLIVPIRVPRPPDGRTVALGGRYLEGVTDAGRPPRPGYKPAKYINSPETPLYQKGHILFGLDQARDAIRKEERAIIVEGYFDVIGVHQAGLPLAVATCGTSLTANHLDLLMRSAAREIIFLFDGDDAGLRAAARAAEMCARAQVPARVATLPDGLDPDEFARQRGVEALRALLERAQPATEMLIDRALNEIGPQPTVEDKVRAVQSVRDIVLAAPEGLPRELYLSRIAERLGVDASLVKGALTNPPRGPARARTPARPGERVPHRPVGPRRTAEDRPNGTESANGTEAPQEAPPPAEPSRARARPNPLAQRTLFAEESIALALLKYPVVAATVAQEGVIAGFGHPELKRIAERVIELQQDAQELHPDQVLDEEVRDEALRGRLRRGLADAETTLEQTVEHLGRVMVKLQEQIERQRARAALAASRAVPAPADETALRAGLEEGQAALERGRLRHIRKRERDRRP